MVIAGRGTAASTSVNEGNMADSRFLTGEDRIGVVDLLGEGASR
jgi:hypothetical protein